MRAEPLWLLVLVLFAACAAPSGPSSVAPSAPTAATAQPAPKSLTIGVLREPTDLGTEFGQGTATTAGGAGSVKLLVHDKLAIEMQLDTWQPELATALPSVDAGTWVVNPDGSMDTTWTIYPNVFWHDGVPFTSDDLMFSFQVFMDPDLPVGSAARRYAESATAPDPHTFVIHWSSTYVDADQGDIGVIRPQHILGDLYQRDVNAFMNSPWFTTEFVGLGPYRLVHWEQGSYMELGRFDAYYQGRPAFDRLVVRFIGDPDALVAAIVAGDLDVVLPVTVDLDAAVDLRNRWEGTGNQVRFDLTGLLPQLEMQYRVDVARPVNGFTQPLVRQAFYEAIDRQSLTQVMTQGLAPVADSWYAPTSPLRAAVESAIPQYPYDPNHALQLLAQAGWTRGPDGVLVDSGGNRFSVELWGLSGQLFGLERQLDIVADDWKAIGADVDIQPIPTSRLSDAQYVAQHPGPLSTSFAARQFQVDRLSSTAIPSAANRWSGFNRGGFSDPQVDALFATLNDTLDPQQRQSARSELVRNLIGGVALMPLYWEVVPTLMVKGVTGPKAVGTDATRNIFQWDRD